MSKSRKDDHIKFAKEHIALPNDFDEIRLIHRSVPFLSINDIDLCTVILGEKFQYPFYINAMTGGNEEGNRINFKLAQLASHFNIPFFVGSQSLAFKEAGVNEEYKNLRTSFPDLFIVANINPNFSVEMAFEAVEMLKANALAIHVNSVQELVMSEGDRDFRSWRGNIKSIIEKINVPVIIKEVGYGMSSETISDLIMLGAKYIDISGFGGTNFTNIELKRTGRNYSPLLDFGISTVDSLINAREFDNVTVYASGGIRNASSIVKALALGASAVGMARYFLDLSDLPLEKMIQTIEELVDDIKKILVLLNAKRIEDLTIEHLFFNN